MYIRVWLFVTAESQNVKVNIQQTVTRDSYVGSRWITYREKEWPSGNVACQLAPHSFGGEAP